MTLVPSESPTTETATLGETNSNAVPSTILNVSDQFGSYGKPNAIVRPVRRNDLNDQMIQSMLQPPTLSLPSTHMNNGNVRNNESKTGILRDVEFSFTKELDIKLKHLQTDKKASSKNVNFWFWILIDSEKIRVNASSVSFWFFLFIFYSFKSRRSVVEVTTTILRYTYSRITFIHSYEFIPPPHKN